MAKVQLGVIFGSRSCEREVSIISAVQLMNHVDSEKYDVIPVYIGENGVWYTGNALRRIETYTPFDPNKAGIEAVALLPKGCSQRASRREICTSSPASTKRRCSCGRLGVPATLQCLKTIFRITILKRKEALPNQSEIP